MPLHSLEDVLTDCVRDLHSAETQLVKALPLMAQAASNAKLKKAFQDHLQETESQVSRLEQIAQHVGIKPTGKTCQAMKGLIAEGQEVIDETGDPAAKDAALIGAARRLSTPRSPATAPRGHSPARWATAKSPTCSSRRSKKSRRPTRS